MKDLRAGLIASVLYAVNGKSKKPSEFFPSLQPKAKRRGGVLGFAKHLIGLLGGVDAREKGSNGAD